MDKWATHIFPSLRLYHYISILFNYTIWLVSDPSLLPEEVDEITIDPEELVFLKDKLCDAEEARRDGD